MDKATDDGAEKAPKKRGKPWVLPVAALCVVGAATGGAFVFNVGGLFAEASASEPYNASSTEGPSEKLPKVMELAPFVVSLRGEGPAGRPPRLRFVVAMETERELSEATDIFRLRNDILQAVQGLELETLKSTEGLEALRAAIAERAEAVLGDNAKRVLITDYILL